MQVRVREYIDAVALQAYVFGVAALLDRLRGYGGRGGRLACRPGEQHEETRFIRSPLTAQQG